MKAVNANERSVKNPKHAAKGTLNNVESAIW